MNEKNLPDTLNDLDKLAFNFFKIYSQFEFALKILGYIKNKEKNTTNIKIDWDKFSEENLKNILSSRDPDVIESCEYLLKNPPKIQFIENGSLTPYKDNLRINGLSSEMKLICNIRQVRNNLFHGGKFGELWFDTGRSKDLIYHSLIILNKIKDTNPKLQKIIKKSTL